MDCCVVLVAASLITARQEHTFLVGTNRSWYFQFALCDRLIQQMLTTSETESEPWKVVSYFSRSQRFDRM